MADISFGSVRVLVGAQNGKYPHGNSLWIRGQEGTAVVDPSLSLRERNAELGGRADLALLSHVHEDHVAALSMFERASVHSHSADLLGITSLDGLMEIYGYGDLADTMRELVRTQFHYAARPDAQAFEDGKVFDLGGVTIRVIHTPGHTRGHCVFLIEPEGVLFLGDIELSSFGPYYGDAWSDLEAFERSLDVVRAIDANVWVSFHHVGVIEQRDAFLARFDKFAARIREREAALLAFLSEPRRMSDLVQHRFLYPAHATFPFIDAVESRTIEQHLQRLLERGEIEQVGEDQWRAR